MPEILSHEEIAKLADRTAQRVAQSGRMEPNPFAPDTDHWRQFKVAFERYLVFHTAPDDVEGGA